MRILRFDSVGGASGDMILGALVALGVDVNEIETELKKLIPEQFSLHCETKSSHGVSGNMLTVEIPSENTHFDHQEDHCHSKNHDDKHSHQHSESHCVKTDHHFHHEHRSFSQIRQMIEESSLDSAVKQNALEIFQTLALAEAEVHQVSPEDVHFHEVGATDSLIDIVGAAIAYHRLNLDGISLSPIPVGAGTVHCAHGVYPLPAPATAVLLRRFELPVSMDNEEFEMLTPTGAAILAAWEKKEIPVRSILKQSVHSFGHYEMKSRPNLLRASIYETETAQNSSDCNKFDDPLLYIENNENAPESLTLLECNIDDATGETLASAMTAIFDAGALDVWFVPIVMKKSRPAQLLSVLTAPESQKSVLTAIFQHSGTFGIRQQTVLRYSLKRHWINVQTEYGTVRMKVGSGFGQNVFSPEFEDCQKSAQQFNVSVQQVMQAAFISFSQKHC